LVRKRRGPKQNYRRTSELVRPHGPAAKRPRTLRFGSAVSGPEPSPAFLRT
jgi:hypothetical protein